MRTDYISFPAGVLSNKREKLPIIYLCDDFFVLLKPDNVALKRISEHLAGQNDLVSREIFPLDDEIAGPIIFAKNKETFDNLRNIYGSQLMEFNFIFITDEGDLGTTSTHDCSLPIAKHFDEDKMLISHTTGKKSFTTFNFVKNISSYEMWSARCKFVRHHQVRLHAAEIGIPVLNDKIYSSMKSVDFTKKFNKKSEDERHWTEDYLPIYLSKLTFEGHEITIDAPRKFAAFVKLLQK